MDRMKRGWIEIHKKASAAAPLKVIKPHFHGKRRLGMARLTDSATTAGLASTEPTATALIRTSRGTSISGKAVGVTLGRPAFPC